MYPVLALVGAPNVGKSTFFNCLTRSRGALVSDSVGLTRDRLYGEGRFGKQPFIVIDTGGIFGEADDFASHIVAQTTRAIEEADAIIFVVSAKEGLTAIDQNIADLLRKQSKPIFLTVNKVDGSDPDTAVAEFYQLGLGQPYPATASQGYGVDQLVAAALMDRVIEGADTSDAEFSEEEDEENKSIRVAIAGRPNVGKSTLVNRLLGEERVIVSDGAGTTRDSVMVPFSHRGQAYTLIDTAGVRRRSGITESVEKFSVVKALQAIRLAHVVIYVIDAQENVVEQDLHLLDFIISSGRALVIAINKWDGLPTDQREFIQNELDRRLHFAKFARKHTISALHGSGVGDLLKFVNQSYESASKVLQTAMLTQILESAVAAHHPPEVQGRRIKLRYAHPGGHHPPTVVIHGNQVAALPKSYQRYLTNVYQKALKLVGTPLRLQFRQGANPFSGRKGSSQFGGQQRRHQGQSQEEGGHKGSRRDKNERRNRSLRSDFASTDQAVHSRGNYSDPNQRDSTMHDGDEDNRGNLRTPGSSAHAHESQLAVFDDHPRKKRSGRSGQKRSGRARRRDNEHH